MASNRRIERVLDRDLDAARLVGKWRCVARYQLKEWLFAGVSDTMVGRLVDRMTERGYFGAQRLHGIGAQLLWLTAKGRDFLVEHGTPAHELYPARGAVALKDLDHTLAIVSAGFALSRRYPAAEAILPAWAIQRAFKGDLEAIPDVLCVDRTHGVLLAVEVDVGGEAPSLVLEKCVSLGAWLASWAADVRSGIVILTSGDRRATSLADRLGGALEPSVGLAVEVLPKGISRQVLARFCTLFGSPMDDTDRSDKPLDRPDGDAAVSV